MSRRETENARRQRYRDNNQCTICGHKLSKDDIENGNTSCKNCRGKRTKSQAKKNKKTYKAAKRNGKCTICKKRKAMEGKTSCGFCSERHDEYRDNLVSAYVEVGLCPCGGTREDKTKKHCEKCRRKGAKRSSASWARKQQAKKEAENASH